MLLDENLPDDIAHQIITKRPDIRIFSIHNWEEGRLSGASDEEILMVVRSVGFTLVSYDINTIPLLLVRLANEDFIHNGIIFINNSTIRSNDYGGLVRALIQLYDAEHDADWTNRIFFLTPSI